MRISLDWLSEYLPGPLDPQAAADALTGGGLPVELIEKVGDDTVIDVEVTSNRSDCLSHVGVARELSALLGREFRDVPTIENTGAVASDKSAALPEPALLAGVRIDAPDLCPHYTARVLRNVRVGPSPAWMVRRLESAGLRSINNVVDITNYVMLEMGQPLHAFDLEKLQGREICVRRAKVGERLVSIDGHERALSADMLVIADAKNPVALAGVMGGRDSEVSPATREVLLESARFDPLCIRATARALAMGSDSSYRYERGIDPLLPERASRRAARLMVELAGATIEGDIAVAGASGYTTKTLWLRLTRLRQVLGVEFSHKQVLDSLARLRLLPILVGERIDVTIPSYRLDLNLEIDLVEEVARVIGYDAVPVRDAISIRLAPPQAKQKTAQSVVSTLVAAGFFEAVTFSFVSDALAETFVPPQATALPRADARVRKADARLRGSILPGLLEAVRHNETAGVASARLFEIGSVFWRDAAGQVQERRRLGLVAGTDYSFARGVLESLLRRLNPNESIQITPASHPGFAAGACGQIIWGGQAIGHIGVVDRAVIDRLSLRESPVALEIDEAPLLAKALLVPQLKSLPKYPAIRRDVSLVLSDATRYEQLAGVIDELKLADLEAVDYVTTYRGKPLPPDSKSITVTLVFRSATSTLTSEAVESAVNAMVESAKGKLQATVRA